MKILGALRTHRKKVAVGVTALALAGGMLMGPGVGPRDAHALGTTLDCVDNAYGDAAYTGTENPGIMDMVCTIRNLAVGAPGKGAAIALIGFGFVRMTGLIGNGGIGSAVIPFLAGVGLANAEGLASTAGYSVE